MSTVIELFKLQMENKFEIFRLKDVKAILLNIAKIFLVLGGITLVVYLVLNRISGLGFNINIELLGIVIMITQAISVIFSINNILNNLYFSKDNEFLVVLPATSNQMFLSKLLVIYFQELLTSLFYTLPLFIVIGILGNFVFYFYLLIPVILLILPFLPISIATFLSVPFVFIIKFLKKHLYLSLTLMLVLVGVGLYFYMQIASAFTDNFGLANIGQQIRTVLRINAGIDSWASNSILFFKLSESFININKIWIFVLYILCGLLLISFSFWVIKNLYFSLILSSMEGSGTKIYSKKEFKSNSVFKSMLKREFLSIFRSNNYVFQYFLFTLLMPIIVLLYDKFVISIAVSQAGSIMIVGSHLLVLSMLALLSNVATSTTITRDGASFYLSKITPNSFYLQSLSKLVFNAIFTISAIVITSCFSLIYFSIWEALATMFVTIFVSIGHLCYSFDLDLKKPDLKWYGTDEISGVTKNTTHSILLGLIISILLGGYVIITASSGGFVTWGVLLLVTLAFAIRKIYVLLIRISYQYNRIEV